jgi:hypothetical protein
MTVYIPAPLPPPTPLLSQCIYMIWKNDIRALQVSKNGNSGKKWKTYTHVTTSVIKYQISSYGEDDEDR